jgi:hypothetical protein
MTKDNDKNFTQALMNLDEKIIDNSEKIEISLDEKTAEKFLVLKEYMEWNNDFLINSSLTLSYKQDIEKLKEKMQDKRIEKDKEQKIKFVATFKNEERIKEIKNDNQFLSFIINIGINEIYSKILGSDISNE